MERDVYTSTECDCDTSMEHNRTTIGKPEMEHDQDMSMECKWERNIDI